MDFLAVMNFESVTATPESSSVTGLAGKAETNEVNTINRRSVENCIERVLFF